MLSRKEKEKILLKALDLKVGDKINVENFLSHGIYEIVDAGDFYELKNECNGGISRSVSMLVICDYTKKVDKVGHKLCDSYKKCTECPLGVLAWTCTGKHKETLFANLDLMKVEDNEVYKLLLDRLNKEVENVNK